MDKKDILYKVQEIVKDVIDNEDIEITLGTTTEEVEGWDSLNHVQIVTEIQDCYKIKFSAKEMISWDNVGDMCDSIASKIN